MSSSTSSLDAPIGDESDSKVSDLIEDESAKAPDAGIEQVFDKEKLSTLLDIMSERERQILDMRFGLMDSSPQTLAEVAKKIGVSRERIRQIEEAALRKLRKFIQQREKE